MIKKDIFGYLFIILCAILTVTCLSSSIAEYNYSCNTYGSGVHIYGNFGNHYDTCDSKSIYEPCTEPMKILSTDISHLKTTGYIVNNNTFNILIITSRKYRQNSYLSNCNKSIIRVNSLEQKQITLWGDQEFIIYNEDEEKLLDILYTDIIIRRV